MLFFVCPDGLDIEIMIERFTFGSQNLFLLIIKLFVIIFSLLTLNIFMNVNTFNFLTLVPLCTLSRKVDQEKLIEQQRERLI